MGVHEFFMSCFSFYSTCKSLSFLQVAVKLLGRLDIISLPLPLPFLHSKLLIFTFTKWLFFFWLVKMQKEQCDFVNKMIYLKPHSGQQKEKYLVEPLQTLRVKVTLINILILQNDDPYPPTSICLEWVLYVSSCTALCKLHIP